MELSEVRVKLINDPGDRLKAVCTVTFDDVFVVRDVKVVEGVNGLFVAMPSRKLSVHCPECKYKNHLRAKFCNECGAELPPYRTSPDANGRSRLHRDLAHPITVEFREELQQRVIAAFEMEVERAKDPNYEPGALDEEDEEREVQPEPARPMSEYDAMIAELRGDAARGRRDEPRQQEGRSGPRDHEAPARGPSREGSRGPRPQQASGPRRPAESHPSSPAPQTRESRGDGRRPPPRPQGPEPRRNDAPPRREAPAPRPVVQEPQTVRKPAPATVASPAKADDDKTGFGAGIL